MDYLNGLPKWTTPESHLKGEKRLFEACHIIVLTIPYAFALETFHTCDPLVSLHNPNPNPSNSCFSPFKWLSGVVHLGNPFRQSMDWGSVFCPLPKKGLTIMVPIRVTCFGLFCIWGQIPNISPRGLIIGGFFAFGIWGAYIRRGLFSEFYSKLNIIIMLSMKTPATANQTIIFQSI